MEGVGASQASVRDAYDVVIWVETEEPTRMSRDLVRLAACEMSHDPTTQVVVSDLSDAEGAMAS